jgi:hypothetical protein
VNQRQRGKSRAAALILAVFALAACSTGYTPGLGELMNLQQMRHDKLWRAGQAQNWELAAYELDELGEGFDDVVRYHPTHKDSPLALTEIVPKIMGESLRRTRAAINGRDPQAFAESYEALTSSCNSCHQATNFGFNVVRRPSDATWFGNQEFTATH